MAGMTHACSYSGPVPATIAGAITVSASIPAAIAISTAVTVSATVASSRRKG